MRCQWTHSPALKKEQCPGSKSSGRGRWLPRAESPSLPRRCGSGLCHSPPPLYLSTVWQMSSSCWNIRRTSGHQGGKRTRAKRLIWSKADWFESMRGNEETNESGTRTLSVQMMSKDKLELKGSLRFVTLMNTQSPLLCNSDSIQPPEYQRG